jgi:alpha-beta hydrolase superfamily lysophospholipase
MGILKAILIVILAIVVAGVVSLTIAVVAPKEETTQRQSELDLFYTPPNPLPSTKPGTIIRSEPVTYFEDALANVTVVRTLSVTRDPTGAPRATGGLLFIPTTPASGERPVVAYAHGTGGLGDACAPSRNPASPMNMPFIQTMADQGWVVTATDYVGLGTPGDPYYLIAASEAEDVVNSVRVAQAFPGSQAGSRYIVMGHSQGGHSAIWTGELSKKLAPELELLGVTVSAPSVELSPLLDQQWNQLIGWAIGPGVLVSWPLVYPKINPNDVLTENGQSEYRDIAYKCIGAAALTAEVQTTFGKEMFAKNPVTSPGFAEALAAQTPKPLPASMPMLMTQAIGDGVVLPNTNAKLQVEWCKAGSNLRVNWLGQLATGPLGSYQTHVNTQRASWPMETDWMQDRFAGKEQTPNCAFTPPVAPAK